MSMALVTFSHAGRAVVARIGAAYPDAVPYFHRIVSKPDDAHVFDHVHDLSGDLFATCNVIVYVAPCGLVIRAIASYLHDKRTDPAVVVIDAGARFVISLLCGHEGGANTWAVRLANVLDAEPVTTTTTDACRDCIVGVGCRKNTPATAIIDAICLVLNTHGIALDRVRMLASGDIKSHEDSLYEAAEILGLPLRFITSQSICESCRSFTHSAFVEASVGVPAVAEPAALLAGRRTKLLVPKTALQGVTVAVAKENCFSLE